MTGRGVAAWLLAPALAVSGASATEKTRELPPSAPAATPESPSRRVVTYRIEARLDPILKTVTGTETVMYRNDSPDSLREIPFHLYPNAFSEDQTLYARETFQEKGPHPALEEAIGRKGWGWMKVGSVRLEDGTDLGPNTTLDETVMRVQLPEALAPGKSVSLRIAWETRLPLLIARMGYWGDHFDVMQWFPKPGVYQDGVWNVHPFHAHSEFFADFGTFDVTLTVPSRFQLEATGVRTLEKDNGDQTRSVTYHAEDVHDFAWVADPNARIAREKSGGVEIVFFHQPYQEEMVPRIMATARECLRRYGEWYLPYPYPRVVIVGLPMGLGGGMEYPMLFTVSMAWFLPDSYLGPESVTAHEFGHEYWYGVVATNEFEEAWLDEGINTYSTLRLLDAGIIRHGPGPTLTSMARFALARVLGTGLPLDMGFYEFDIDQLLGFKKTPFFETKATLLGYPLSPFNLNLPGLTTGQFLSRKNGYVQHGTLDPMETPSWEFYPGNYSDTVYSKTALALKTLERMVGPEKMGRILREYIARHRFTHPKAGDFLRVAGEVSGADLRAFSDQLVFGTETVDFAVGPVKSERVKEPIGFRMPDRPGGALRELKGGGAPGETYRTEGVVRRMGGAVLPVDVVFNFEDGSSVRERWDAARRWQRYAYVRSSKLRSLVVDPERVYAVDLNFNNNSYTLHPQNAAVRKVSVIWLFWLQNYLMLVSSLF